MKQTKPAQAMELRSLSPVFGRLDAERMKAGGKTSRFYLSTAGALLTVTCASPNRVIVREWPKGEFVYTLNDAPVQLSLSREASSQVSEAEEFLSIYSHRLKRRLDDLDKGGYLPAMCHVWIVLFTEPQVDCSGGGPGQVTSPLEESIRGALPPVLPSVGPQGNRKILVLLDSRQSRSP